MDVVGMRASAAYFSYHVETDSSPVPFKMKKRTIALVFRELPVYGT
jgi:hypothetical protein